MKFLKFSVIFVSLLSVFTIFSGSAFAAVSFWAGNNSVAPVNSTMLNFTWTNSTPLGNVNATANITFILPYGAVNVSLISALVGNSSTNVSSTSSLRNITTPNASMIIFGNSTLLNDSSTLAANFTFNVSSTSAGFFTINVTESYNISNVLVSIPSTIYFNIQNGTITLTNATFSNVTYSGGTGIMNFTASLSSPTGGGTVDNITFNLYLNASGTNALLIQNATCIAASPCSNTVIFANSTNATAAGLYFFNFNTTGSNNYTAASLNATLNIAKASPFLFLYLNNDTQNKTITYPATTELRANSTNSTGAADVTFNLYVNSSTGVTTFLSTGNAAFNSSIILGNDTWNVVYNTTGGANYTSASNNTLFLLVNKGTPNVMTWLNNASANETITYPATTEIRGNSTTTDSTGTLPTFKLYVNNSTTGTNMLISIGMPAFNSSLVLGNGTWQVVYNTSGNGNWTTAQNNSLYLFVYKGILTLSISGANYTYPNSVYINATRGSDAVDADVNYTLWRNTTLVTSGLNTSGNVTDTSLQGVNNFTYIYNATGGANWTANASGVSLALVMISQGTPSISVTFSPSDSVSYGTQTTATGNGCPTSGAADVTCSMNRAATGGITTGVSNPDVENLNAGTTYTYTFSEGGGANWTSTSTTGTLSIGGLGSSSGGGGGGASSSSSGVATVGTGSFTLSISSLSPSGTTASTISNSDTHVTEMDINAKNTVSNVGITVSNVQLPSGTPAPSGTSYSTWQVNMTNVGDSDINSVVFKFSVAKSWLTSNNIDKNSIKLQRYSNGAWTTLATSILSEDNNNVYYSATSPGLSYFAVSGQSSSTSSPTSTQTTQTQTQTQSQTVSTSTSSAQPSYSLGNLGGTQMIIAAIVIVAILVFLAYRFLFIKK